MTHSIQTPEGLDLLDKHLSEQPYVSSTDLPNAEDAQIFLDFKGTAPNRENHPNLYIWYQNLRIFHPTVIQAWSEEKPVSSADTADSDAKTNGEIDLFEEESEEDKKKLEEMLAKRRAEMEAKNGKVISGQVSKSFVVIEVKFFEVDQDYDESARKILALEIEGLVWRPDYKKVQICFCNHRKLQIGCVIEDDKVCIDDVIERILTEWEDEIQSVDIVSFAKL